MQGSDLRTAGVQRSPVTVGALVGLAAGVPAGIVLQFGTEMLAVLGGVTGTQSLLVGWLIHLGLSGLFGAFFGWHLKLPVFRTLTDSTAGCVFWGILFGTVWYAYLMIGIVFPVLVDYLASTGPGTPYPAVPGLFQGSLFTAGAFAISYLLYGGILGFGYAALEDVRAEPEPRGPDPEREHPESE